MIIKATNWYSKIFNTVTPSKFPAKSKNGKNLQSKLPSTPLNRKAITNTVTIPTRDTASLIAPFLKPPTANINKISISAMSKILILITSTPYTIIIEKKMGKFYKII